MNKNSKNEFSQEIFLKYSKFLSNNPNKASESVFQKILNEFPQCPYFYFLYADYLFQKEELRKSNENILYALELNSKNFQTNKEYFNYTPNDEDVIILLLLLRVKVLDKLTAPLDEIKDALMDLKNEIEANPTHNDHEKYKHFIKKISEKWKINLIKPQLLNKRSLETKSPQEVHLEAKEVLALMESSDNSMKEEGFPVNIISMSWFLKWKKYTNFYLISGERGDDVSMELSQESEKTSSKPGPINQDDILSSEKILIDPDKIKNYCNMILKPGLEENKDFLIVSHKVWKYLYKIYGGQEIKRFIVSVNDDSNLTHVEMILKKVSLFYNLYIIPTD